jgi:hypothetical protein
MTAVEFLMDKLFDPTFDNQKQIEWFEQAREMEKQQIINAYNIGFTTPFEIDFNTSKSITAEQYYNQTFKKK